MFKDISLGFISNAIGLLINMFLIPFYISNLGIESYSIISLVGTIFSLFVFIEAGSAMAIMKLFQSNRNIIKNEISSLFSTIQVMFLFVGILSIIILFIFREFYLKEWFNFQKLDFEIIDYSFIIITILIFFKWQINFYYNILISIGSLKTYYYSRITYVVSNALLTVLLINLKVNVVSILILIFVLNVLLSIFLYINLKNKLLFSFSIYEFNENFFLKFINLLKKVGPYAIITVYISSLDRFILSKELDLSDYGYFIALATLFSAMSQALYPLTTALFNRFSVKWKKNEKEISFKLLEKVFLFFLAISLSILISFISTGEEALYIWTGNSELYLTSKPYSLIYLITLILFSFTNLLYIPISVIGNVSIMNISSFFGLFFYLINYYFGLIGNSILITVILSFTFASSIILISQIVILFNEYKKYKNYIIKFLLRNIIPMVLISIFLIYNSVFVTNIFKYNLNSIFVIILNFLIVLFLMFISSDVLRNNLKILLMKISIK